MWGKRDNAVLTGDVAVVNGSNTVTGTGTAFATEVTLKDVVEIEGVRYRVVSIANNTSLELHTAYEGASSGNNVPISVQDLPKYVPDADIRDVVFVDMTEALVQANKDKGLRPGWNLVKTYVDADGDTRWKVEPLVPMKVAQADAGDASDDSTVADA